MAFGNDRGLGFCGLSRSANLWNPIIRKKQPVKTVDIDRVHPYWETLLLPALTNVYFVRTFFVDPSVRQKSFGITYIIAFTWFCVSRISRLAILFFEDFHIIFFTLAKFQNTNNKRRFFSFWIVFFSPPPSMRVFCRCIGVVVFRFSQPSVSPLTTVAHLEYVDYSNSLFTRLLPLVCLTFFPFFFQPPCSILI